MMDDDRISIPTHRMANLLDRYRARDISLGRLVSGLEASIEALDGIVEPARVEDLRSEWWRVEAVYATMLDEGRAGLSDSEQHSVEQALESLGSMITGP